MLCIHNTQTDPYFNLAAEEYLLKDFKENIFMLWQNEPSIVIGKHQDVCAEVNLKFVQDQQIKIARRFSGGGAVYHNPENLNLTFIETGQIMQTDKYTIQIMNFLKTLGIHVEVDERKGLTIGGFKISGSAQSIHKNRYMHHATLLFSTDLDRLVTSLKSTSRQAPEGEDNGAQPETSEATQPKEQIPAPVPEELSKNSQKEDRWYSPVVMQLAKAAGVSQDELDHIPGTGYLGRLSKKDIQTYIDHKNKGTEMPKPKQAPVSSMQQTATSTPTITVAPPTAPSMPMTATTPSAPLAQGDEVREMDRVRKIITDHTVLSKKVSPHVTSVIEVDVTRLVNWRKKVKDQFLKQEGINLTYMPAITEATAKALKAYPLVNSSVDGYNIILKKPINIGIAVSLNDGNLIVPVIHDADKLNLSGLASQIDTSRRSPRE